MAIFESAVLTRAGNELLVTAAAGKKITFTRLVTGSGIYEEDEKKRAALENAEALKQQRQEFPFSAYEKVSEKSILLKALISNKTLSEGYKMTEVGIYGKEVGAETDVLCSIAVTTSLEETDSFPPYNGLRECQIIQEYYVTISPDAEVTIETQGAAALAEDLVALQEIVQVQKETVDNLVKIDIGDNAENQENNSIYLLAEQNRVKKAIHKSAEGTKTEYTFRAEEDEKKKNLQTYTSLTQLEVSTPATMVQIYNALPDNSYLILNVDNTSTITDPPNGSSSGLLEIIKSVRNLARFTQSLSTAGNAKGTYYGTFSWADEVVFNGWKLLLDKTMIANNCTTTAEGYALDARQGKELMDKANQLNSELSANDTKFYFDYKDGQWGFNTDPARGADTFHPFDGDWTLSFLLSCGATVNVNGEIVSPSGSGTVTIKCSNRAISQTSGTTVRGGGGHPVHSNECHASVSNFQLSYS